MSEYSDDQLLRLIEKMGREMTSASSARHGAMEKDRFILVKEAMKRGLLGYPAKKKYYSN